jgi:hypothetical protein
MYEDIKQYITVRKKKVVKIKSPSEFAYNMMSVLRVNRDRKRAISSTDEISEFSWSTDTSPTSMPEWEDMVPGTKIGGDYCCVFKRLSGNETTKSFLPYDALFNILSTKHNENVSSRIPIRTPPGSLVLVDLKAVDRSNNGEVTYLSDCRRHLQSHWRQQSLKHLTRRRNCRVLSSHLRHWSTTPCPRNPCPPSCDNRCSKSRSDVIPFVRRISILESTRTINNTETFWKRNYNRPERSSRYYVLPLNIQEMEFCYLAIETVGRLSDIKELSHGLSKTNSDVFYPNMKSAIDRAVELTNEGMTPMKATCVINSSDTPLMDHITGKRAVGNAKWRSRSKSNEDVRKTITEMYLNQLKDPISQVIQSFNIAPYQMIVLGTVASIGNYAR